MKLELGHYYEGIKTRENQALKFTTYFTLRRMATVALLLGMTTLPFFQTQLLMLLSTATIIYLLAFRPYISNSRNVIECLNEACILYCAHMSVLLLNDALESSVKTSLGWSMVVIATINVFFNVACAIYFAIF